jgi:hypothetical protein
MLRRLIALAVGLVLVMGITSAFAVQPQYDAANRAVQYIESLQNDDGGFPAFGTDSSPGATIDAVFALIAVGVDPAAVTRNDNSPIDYLESQAATYAQDPGGAAKLAYGVALMGLDITNFGGQNLVAIMNANYNSGTGSYGLGTFDEVFYIYALARAGQPIPSGVNPYLRSLQQGDGGWEFASGQGSDSNTTAFALQALLAAIAGPGDSTVQQGLAYLHTTQNADGGFGFLPGADSDPNSTAVVIQALVAAGQGIDEHSAWSPGGNTPIEALLSFQNPETGAFQYGGVDSAFATYQAVPALMLAPFPDLETREVREPTPQAPTAIEVTKTATPTVVIGGLPDAGGGAREGRTPWWAIAALVGGGVTAIGAGAAGWRSR